MDPAFELTDVASARGEEPEKGNKGMDWVLLIYFSTSVRRRYELLSCNFRSGTLLYTVVNGV